ncbi:MAG: GTPase HflX [Firmicutes bacterium]|nr:GTPase HflX [Bacillota bacterium]MBQ6842333.1 GTPase HflX [Bacillota bacterium]
MLEKGHEYEKAILVGVYAENFAPADRSTEESLEELAELLKTAGGIEAGRTLQKRRTPDPRSFIGRGKVEEVKLMVLGTGSNLVVFDNELSPSQTRVLAEELGVRVIDRSALILDIFAQRAQTREGRLQVELAQYKYLLPRLTGMWTHLDRETASGGSSPIGTRGTGETQLESDRRYIRARIEKLEEELRNVRQIRATQRSLRQQNGVPVVALVGYTNAGKSTLLNCLTDAGIQTGNRLFDTLDTTTRRLRLSPTCEVLLSDTVGFIRKLPHHLVEAFKATLEELSYADVILHVIDISNPEWQAQAEVVEKLIAQLCPPQTPKLEVYNKADRLDAEILPHGADRVSVSALTGQGIDELKQLLLHKLDADRRQLRLLLPYAQGGVLDELHRGGKVLSVDYEERGIVVEVILPPDLAGRYGRFAVDAQDNDEE